MSKPVSLIELFYDLVFVYMLSQATELIRELEKGAVPITSLGVFIFIVIVFINSWMIQTIFTNRYGQSSWTDIAFFFVDMMIVLYMSNSFSTDLNANLQPFYFAAGLLSLTLFMQYMIIDLQTKTVQDRQIAQAFGTILGIRTVTFFTAGTLPRFEGLLVALIGIGISWIAPSLTGKYTRQHPVIFSHLLERLTELTIVVFGETIVGIAGYFTKASFSITSVFIFLIVASLFFAYITEFDHLIDEKRQGETGNLLIYLHYPIIFGISMMTVALRFVAEPDVNHLFAVSFLYTGFALMYFGLWVARTYNQPRYRQRDHLFVLISGIIAVAYFASLKVQQFSVIILISALATMICCIGMVSQIYRYQNLDVG